MEKQNPWLTLSNIEKDTILQFNTKYKNFLNEAKTERKAIECVKKEALSNGFVEASSKETLCAGDKIFYTNRNKNIVLIVIGKNNIEEGSNFIISHVDSPRLDIKPSPLVEEDEIALLKTQYYGGIKKYQWLSRPLAIHGIMFLQNGNKIDITIGEDENDPVFVVPDILPHLDKKIQREKKVTELIEGENLKVIFGSLPINTKEKNKIKSAVLTIIKERYNIEEEDFVSAEVEIVPAGKAKDVGIDRALIGAYGQDDKICAYTSVQAILNLKEIPLKTAVCFLADKEEIGSTGSTSLQSRYLEYFVSDIVYKLKKDAYNNLLVQKTLWNSRSISADVCAAINPLFKSVHDEQNAAKIGYGVSIVKYTGHNGKIEASDADAELVSYIRTLLNTNNIAWQVSILGKVDEGGGGTVAKFAAHYGIQTIDMGPAIISMHSPFELSSKFDTYTSYKAYKAFFEG